MSFWENFVLLCKENGEKPTVVVNKLGLSSGNIARWKNGGSISLENGKKIAEHFNVQMERLTSDDAKAPPTTRHSE